MPLAPAATVHESLRIVDAAGNAAVAAALPAASDASGATAVGAGEDDMTSLHKPFPQNSSHSMPPLL